MCNIWLISPKLIRLIDGDQHKVRICEKMPSRFPVVSIPEAERLYRDLITRAKGHPSKEETNGDNITIKLERGTLRRYTLDRLKRDRPDLFERVKIPKNAVSLPTTPISIPNSFIRFQYESVSLINRRLRPAARDLSGATRHRFLN